eukprot:scaffold7740_cov112-Isochrysis_galbana.AAC.5
MPARRAPHTRPPAHIYSGPDVTPGVAPAHQVEDPRRGQQRADCGEQAVEHDAALRPARPSRVEVRRALALHRLFQAGRDVGWVEDEHVDHAGPQCVQQVHI